MHFSSSWACGHSVPARQLNLIGNEGQTKCESTIFFWIYNSFFLSPTLHVVYFLIFWFDFLLIFFELLWFSQVRPNWLRCCRNGLIDMQSWQSDRFLLCLEFFVYWSAVFRFSLWGKYERNRAKAHWQIKSWASIWSFTLIQISWVSNINRI